MPKKKPAKPIPRVRLKALPSPDAITFTIRDAQAISGLGQTTLYKLKQEGLLEFRKVLGRTLVVGESLRALLGQGGEAA